MNIAIISTEYPPWTNYGGVATFNYNLVRVLSRQGHQVHVVTCDESRRERIENDAGVIIHFVPFKTSVKLFNFFYYHFIFGFFRRVCAQFFPHLVFLWEWNLFSFLWFRTLDKHYHFDVIHCQSYDCSGLLICPFFEKQIVCHIQGPRYLTDASVMKFLDQRLCALLEQTGWHIPYRRASLVCCSRDLMQRIACDFPSLLPRLTYHHNSVDCSIYSNTRRVNSDSIVFFGRKDFRKGVDILLDTFLDMARTNEVVTLLLIGDDGYDFPLNGHLVSFSDYYFQKINRVPMSIRNRIKLMPRIDNRQELIALLKRYKGIGVFPSRYEPFGFSVLEAMAMGYVVIASTKGGAKEYITHGVNGFLSQPSIISLKKIIKVAYNLPFATLTHISNEAMNTAKTISS